MSRWSYLTEHLTSLRRGSYGQERIVDQNSGDLEAVHETVLPGYNAADNAAEEERERIKKSETIHPQVSEIEM